MKFSTHIIKLKKENPLIL